MNILGISAFYHDSAAALIVDGQIIAAAQEERFSRIKHDQSFPKSAVAYCLKEARLTIDEINCIAFYDKPVHKFDRLIETYLSFAPRGWRSFSLALPLWLDKKLHLPKIIKEETGYMGKVLFTEHHEAHAASAFFPSPFNDAAVICFDGVGEWATTTWGVGKGNLIEMKEQIKFPHSLGLLYSAFTYYAGFKVNSGEYKLMGLAPYGKPVYADLIKEEIIAINEDGSFHLNMEYFKYCYGLTMTNEKFDKLFGGRPRKPESSLSQKEMNVAASIQAVTEEIILKIAKHVKAESGMKNLCMAGGVALNCVCNGKIHKENIYDKIWIQPAAGDAGGALGAALAIHHHYFGLPRSADGTVDSQSGSYLGPSFGAESIRAYLQENNYLYRELDEDNLITEVAAGIERGNVVGWFQGRMEFGPRALGARSILGDARDPEMQKKMNIKIKYRESFRPFAPSVLREHVSEWFDYDGDSPYMLMVADVRKAKLIQMTVEQENMFGLDKVNVPRSVVPAITHVDYSARIQTVDDRFAPRYYKLIRKFYDNTGCPLLINTSFNVRGEPLVCTPEEAYRCFMRTDMDILVIENFILEKNKQPVWHEVGDWRKEVVLD